MTTKEFVSKYKGKGIDFDGAYGFQCVDSFNQYLVEVLNISKPIEMFPVASAYQIWGYAKNNPNFQRIDNTPNAVPQEGDIIIWGQGVGPHGHVAIYLKGDVFSFTSFDQNWNNVQKCVEVKHNYDHITGWLRPIKKEVEKPSDCETKLKEMRASRDKWKKEAEELKKAKPKTTNLVAETPKSDNKLVELIRPYYEKLDGNKTYVSVGAMLVAVVLYQLGYISEDVFNTLDVVFLALVGFSLRDAIKKK
jgi:hypothetical protein